MKSLKTMSLAALMALAATAAQADEKTLTVYTYDSFTAEWGPGPQIKKNFEAECDCTLNWVAVDSSISILSKIQLEGSGSKADIALGLDTNLVKQAKETGLFAETNVAAKGLSLPIDWQDKTFIPFDYGYFAFIYDSKKMDTPPTSLKALIEAPDDLKIIIQDPRTSTPGLGLMLWVREVYGDEAPKAWKKLSGKIVTATKGWYEGYSMFLEGEADMVLSYTTSPAYHIEVESEEKYKAAAFAEGHYMQVEVAAKLKNSPNQALADQFLAFMLSEGFQSVIPTGNWMYPVTDTNSLPNSFGSLVKPAKSLIHAPEEVAEKRKDWTGEWLNAMSQ
ncbi:thiamine ABC transporter substrate binding subunit [Aestuariispira insulae]|uniref:Thiamine-binding periplasmic protein n=1 Tax=Aestuariispira insulae TaxID=1461337 RepID=A0A3D9HUG8_9PROT|nr:thiamine ABC transporter substrate binding subunit [Aestuariispira insulae]RED52526.1 thiamine transport system substrate-binding protein [Aestuariispira insulae]